jgi:hypothetical protein
VCIAENIARFKNILASYKSTTIILLGSKNMYALVSPYLSFRCSDPLLWEYV